MRKLRVWWSGLRTVFDGCFTSPCCRPPAGLDQGLCKGRSATLAHDESGDDVVDRDVVSRQLHHYCLKMVR